MTSDETTPHPRQTPPARRPLLIGPAHGRVAVPLRDVPDGVRAVTIPRKGSTPDDSPRIPRDPRRRLHPKQVDLIADQPIEAYQPPPGITHRDLVKVLRTGVIRQWSTVQADFGDRAWSLTVDLLRHGAVVLRCDVVEARHYTPRHWRLSDTWLEVADDKLAELTGHRDPAKVHANLLRVLADVPQLANEHRLLAATAPGARALRVPSGTTAGTDNWRVYEYAVMAACTWWTAQGDGQPRLTAKSLAAQALRNSKQEWTASLQQAFANLVGVPFDLAVDRTDTALRIRGPLQWRMGTVVADAATSRPWIAMPAHGLWRMGSVACTARGILIVENDDTHQFLCRQPELAEDWLLLWGKGYATHGVVEFLQAMAPLPLAAWCDLDAHGVNIVNNLTKRVGRQIIPVGMDTHLYTGGKKYQQDPEAREGSLKLATELAVTGPSALRDLAQAIVEAGGDGCEQETLYSQVVPGLHKLLTSLESPA